MLRESIDSIFFKNLTIEHGDRKVLKNSNFSFPMGTNCRIIFHNDVDKFFFYHSLSTIKGLSGGGFFINEQNILELSFEEFLKYRKNIGFGFSTRGLLHNRSLRQNVMLPLAYHEETSEAEANEWVSYLFDFFGVTKEQHLRPADVVSSTQKVALLLRALVMKPEWLILDSPDVFLSRRLHANLLQLLEDHQKYHNLKHIFFSTSDEDLAHCLAEATLILEKQNLRILNVQVRNLEAVV